MAGDQSKTGRSSLPCGEWRTSYGMTPWRLISAVYRAQADALEIESMAKRRLADEYDAAQERGEVVGPKGGGDSTVPVRNAATVADIGLTRKDIHEARQIRDAEVVEPGITRRAIDARLDQGLEPTKADSPPKKRWVLLGKNFLADRATARFR
ncbi:hypothetical protein [Rhizobium multihospitium]|uniref:hypothetical protein n=1 Tax=Rhizobium multihospitium TaxID=410764 RepID=UPI00142DCCCC|nr:hypothetical protein [Rhizobium multihospitium]